MRRPKIWYNAAKAIKGGVSMKKAFLYVAGILAGLYALACVTVAVLLSIAVDKVDKMRGLKPQRRN